MTTLKTFTTANFNIKYTGINFAEWFGTLKVKPKKWTPYFVTLPKAMNEQEIFAEYSPTEITLSELAYLLETKEKMLVSGYANIFYIKDVAGVLRTVIVRWRGDGWRVRAHSVGYPYGWYGGYQVFSRNSLKLNPSVSMPLGNSDTLTLPDTLEINGVKYKKI